MQLFLHHICNPGIIQLFPASITPAILQPVLFYLVLQVLSYHAQILGCFGNITFIPHQVLLYYSPFNVLQILRKCRGFSRKL